MKVFWMLLSIIFVCGCIRQGFDYKTVYVKYTVSGGIVQDDQYTTEYVIDNTQASHIRKSQDGKVSFVKRGNITKDTYERLGRTIVEAGYYGMLDKYGKEDGIDNRPRAELSVSIDGKNKTILFQPYLEEFTPGNIQKVIFDVRDIAQ